MCSVTHLKAYCYGKIRGCKTIRVAEYTIITVCLHVVYNVISRVPSNLCARACAMLNVDNLSYTRTLVRIELHDPGMVISILFR